MSGKRFMTKRFRAYLSAAMLVCLVLKFAASLVTPASAQGEAPSDTGDSAASVTVYDSEFFAPYNPISVEDILNRIPGTEGLTGFNANNADERRGLRANTDQILINGKRLTGKQNTSGDFLGSLPAKSVERVEIITGNVRELDADVGARVINVILKDDTGRGSGTWTAGFAANWEGQKRPVPSLSYTGTSDALSYTLNLQLRPGFGRAFVTDTITSESGDTLQIIEEQRKSDAERYTGRGSVSYDFSGGSTLQLNGFIRYFPRDNTDTTLTFEPLAGGGRRETFGIAEDINGEDITWELGADYNQAIGKSAKFTGLFIRSNTTVDQITKTFERFRNSDLNQLGGDNEDRTATETILRGTVNWNFADRHDLEVGVEGAINTLKKDLNFFTLVDGEQVDSPVFNSDQDINEDRVEAFTTHSWKPIPALEIQTGLAAEFSWLTQTGSDVNENRSFKFVKPSLDIWYNADEFTQLWFSFLRDVGQLDFDDFVATVNRADDEVLAGNPELAPEKSWNFEVGAERRLANGVGVLNGRMFYRRINDVKDLLPFGPANSQPGNLGNGNHYGFEIDGSLRLKRLTSIDVVLNSTFLLQDSEVTDPFTGLRRRIAMQPQYKATFGGRYDHEAWGVSYNLNLAKKGRTIESDYNEFDIKTTGYDLRMSVEKSIGNGMSVRVFFGNVLDQHSTRTRTRFATTQAAGVIQQNEFRRQKSTRFTGASIRGTF